MTASIEPETAPNAGLTGSKASSDSAVDHPAHYGGKDNPYEAIKVIEAWRANFHLGSVLKYLCRSCLRPSLIRDPKTLEDLKKARWYLDREIQSVEQVVRAGEGTE